MPEELSFEIFLDVFISLDSSVSYFTYVMNQDKFASRIDYRLLVIKNYVIPFSLIALNARV
jgi:hypothetical protein